MISGQFPSPSGSPSLTLVVRRTISAPAEFLFDAWTQPKRLKEWWGQIIWITGEYEHIDAPHRLVYTWCVEHDSRPLERVTVEFKPRDTETEVTVTHERIPDAGVREQHDAGWRGCLDGLAEYARHILRDVP